MKYCKFFNGLAKLFLIIKIIFFKIFHQNRANSLITPLNDLIHLTSSSEGATNELDSYSIVSFDFVLSCDIFILSFEGIFNI